MCKNSKLLFLCFQKRGRMLSHLSSITARRLLRHTGGVLSRITKTATTKRCLHNSQILRQFLRCGAHRQIWPRSRLLHTTGVQREWWNSEAVYEAISEQNKALETEDIQTNEYSGFPVWCTSEDGIRINHWRLLEDNPKYCSTVYRPVESTTGYGIDKNMSIEETMPEIKKLVEKRKVREAMDNFGDVMLKAGSEKEGQKHLEQIEKWVSRQVQMISLPDVLYVLDGFIQMSYRPKDQVLDGFIQMGYRPKYLVRTLLRHVAVNFKSIEKSPANIIHVLYLIGVSRDASPELMQYLHAYVEENIQEFDSIEIGFICWAFKMMNTKLSKDGSLLTTMAEKLIQELRDPVQTRSRSRGMSLYLITHVLKAFKDAKFRNVTFYEELGDVICDADWGIKSFSPERQQGPPLAHLAYAYSSMGVKHERLFESIEQKLSVMQNTVIHDVRKFRLKDLARLCDSYSNLRMNLPKFLMDEVMYRIDDGIDKFDTMSSKEQIW